MCKTQITSHNDVQQFTQMFIAMYSSLQDHDLKNLKFIHDFAQWLISKGMRFCGNWDIEDQILSFSSVPCPKFPIKITLRFESGLRPLCYWIKQGMRSNHRYSEKEHDDVENWFIKLFEQYQ